MSVRNLRLATVSVVLALILAGCSAPSLSGGSSGPGTATGGSGTPVSSGPVLAVLGTENFYADLLSQIGGQRVAATSLLNDPNTDPHAFEASPKAAATVADAKLVIVNGLGYDGFMQKLLGASTKPERVVISVQELLGLKDDVNAHVWYDPATMPKIAEAAAAAFTKLDPQNAAYFAARKATYLASLGPIDEKIGQLKAKYSGAPVAFTEPVAEYLTDAIGLTVLTPKGFQEAVEQGVEPSPADVAAARDLLTGKKVKVLLYNSQVTSPLTQGIQDLAKKNGVPVVGVAETILPAFRTFQEWMLAQLKELEQALAK